MTYDQAKRAYARLHSDVREVVGPEFRVPLVLGESDEFPMPRNMAFCTHRSHDSGQEDIAIVIAPKLLRGNRDRVQAILRHELAHAIEFHLGENEVRRLARFDGETLPRGPERRADRVAEIIWGDPIHYDEILVQTLARGTRPRPQHLGP